jgi:hypothetical protein
LLQDFHAAAIITKSVCFAIFNRNAEPFAIQDRLFVKAVEQIDSFVRAGPPHDQWVEESVPNFWFHPQHFRMLENMKQSLGCRSDRMPKQSLGTIIRKLK